MISRHLSAALREMTTSAAKLRVQYISDVHLEFGKTVGFEPCHGADVLCLAGDIGYPFSSRYEDFLKDCAANFKKVFLITGNHEYYQVGKQRKKSMEEIQQRIEEIIQKPGLNGVVSFLDNSYEDYCGVRFAGSTLWSRLAADSDTTGFNDFNQIGELNVPLYNELHSCARDFLGSPDIAESPLPVCVMTHHLPLLELIDPKYRESNHNQFFASDCSDLILPSVRAWIYGHTHTPNSTFRNGVRFVCNPVGYPGERDDAEFNAVVDIHA